MWGIAGYAQTQGRARRSLMKVSLSGVVLRGKEGELAAAAAFDRAGAENNVFGWGGRLHPGVSRCEEYWRLVVDDVLPLLLTNLRGGAVAPAVRALLREVLVKLALVPMTESL